MSKLWGLALRQPPSWILKLLILFEEYLKLATATRNELGNCFLGKLIKWHFFFQCSRPLLAIRNHADLKPFRNWWSSKVFFFCQCPKMYLFLLHCYCSLHLYRLQIQFQHSLALLSAHSARAWNQIKCRGLQDDSQWEKKQRRRRWTCCVWERGPEQQHDWAAAPEQWHRATAERDCR